MSTQTSVSKQVSTLVMALAIGAALLAACGGGNRAEAPAPAPVPVAATVPSVTPDSAPIEKSMPAVSPSSPASPLGSVDQILASMDWANIAFNSPPKLNLKETAQVQLLLSLRKTIDELRTEIAAAGEREGAKVKVSNRMQARLSGVDFQIIAVTDEEQAVGATDTVEWKWEIKPLAAGRHSLHLTLTALFSVDGAATRRAVRTFDKTIQVEVSAGQLASDFFGKNWQWLWAAILLPIAGWLWKRWKGWRGAAEKSE